MKALLLLSMTAMLSTSVLAEEHRMVQAGKAFIGDVSSQDLEKLKKGSGKFKRAKIKKKTVKEISIKQNDSISFINLDRVSHNISNKELGLDKKQPKFKVEPHKVAFKEKGTYEVKCKVHPNMKIKVNVE